MPHGWRLPARSPVSPRGCETEPSPPIATAVAGALVDRTPIDWPALLDRIRSPQDPSVPPPGRDLRIVLLRLLVGVAALQTCSALPRGALAIWNSGTIGALLPPLLVAAAFASAGLLLASVSARDRRVLLLMATFAFAASAFARAIVTRLSGGLAESSLLFRGVFPEAFVPAALWQFAVIFPTVHRFTRFDLRARTIAAAAWMVSAYLFVANLIVGYGWLARPLRAFGRDDPGNLFWHVFAAAALPAFLAIFVRAYRSPPVERSKAVRFGWALAGGAAPLLLTGLARLTIPGVDRWVAAPGGIGRLAVDAAVVGALALMPILATLAVIVDRPFELGGIVPARARRWLAAHMGSFRRHRRREWLTAALDRIRFARGSREIAAVVCRELRFGVGARAVRILAPGDLPRDSALPAVLEESSGPIALARDSELFALLPKCDRTWLESHGVALASPIRLRDGAMAAVAVLGPPRGGAPYDRIDRWFVSTLLTGAAVAWDVADDQPGREPPAFECERCGGVSDAPPAPCACGAASIPASLPRRLAGKFEVIRRLGAGGAGVAYLARDMALGRDVALKTLPALRGGSVARLRDEARAMATLNHGSLAIIYGLEVWRGTPVLVVEYMSGGTLAERLMQGPLPRAEVVALGIRLADALTYMHERGLLHRDVKPSNIGLTSDGVAKLLDFGLSADAGTPAGTPAYLPPETLDGAPADAAMDLWGLATVLLEAGGGRYADLGRFFDRALASHRGDRFASSAELRNALLRLQR